MRIIAGEMRSRTILAPRGNETRPTLDRTRESLFNIIAAYCPGARVLDLYAGSGALGLEAVSRGAEYAVFCDMSREAARVIRLNIESLGVPDRCRLLHMPDARAAELLGREGERFDLVFLDPPYRMDCTQAFRMLDKAGILLEGALIAAEHAADSAQRPSGAYRLTDERKYRDTVISFYKYERGDIHGQSAGVSGQL